MTMKSDTILFFFIDIPLLSFAMDVPDTYYINFRTMTDIKELTEIVLKFREERD